MGIIETERLTLRWAREDDAEFMLELLNDPGWIRYIGDKKARTPEDARRYIVERLIASYEANGFGLYITELKSLGAPVGICGLVKRQGLDVPDVGFAFLERHSRKGYGYESAAAVLEHGRRAFRLTTIAAVTTPENHASIRLLEKLGLRFERMIRLTSDAEELALYTTDSGAAPGGVAPGPKAIAP